MPTETGKQQARKMRSVPVTTNLVGSGHTAFASAYARNCNIICKVPTVHNPPSKKRVTLEGATISIRPNLL